MSIKLGSKVKCLVTLAVGVATGRIEYLHGSPQIHTTFKDNQSGVPVSLWIEEAQLEVTEGNENAAPKTSKENVKDNAPKASKTDKSEDTEAVKLAALKVKFSVLKKLSGAKACKDILTGFDCTKFADIVGKQIVFIVKEVDAAIEAARTKETAGAVEETHEDQGEVKESSITYDQVKELLVQISNHDDLGREVAKDIIKATGAKKMAEIPKDKFDEVFNTCTVQLKEVEGDDL